MIRVSSAFLLAVAFVGIAWSQSSPPYVFTPDDLKLLAETEAFESQLETRGLVYHDAALERYLAELAAPMLPGGPVERVKWQFHILRDPMVNAFALPNGSVYVNIGFLARAENDEQVAAVLAHEITHVVNRHTFLALHSMQKKVVISEVLGVAAGWIPVPGGWGVVLSLGNWGGQFILVDLMYGYSRKLEREADTVGIELMKRAQRNPRQMARLFEIVAEKLEPEPVPRVLLDHPRLRDRVTYLKDLTRDSKPADGIDVAFVRRMRPVLIQNIQLEQVSRRFRSALASAQRLTLSVGSDAEAEYWQGEAYRMLGPRQPRLSALEQTDKKLRSGYSRTLKRTEQEDYSVLAGTPEGQAALKVSQQQAEEHLLRATSLDPSLADPYFSLGDIYEQQKKTDQAIGAYRKFVERCRQPADRERAQRRIAQLEKPAQGSVR